MGLDGLPLNSTTYEKPHRSRGYWAYLPIPGFRDRMFRVWVPHTPPIFTRGRKRRPLLLLCLGCFSIFFIILLIKKIRPRYPQSTGDEPSTLVFRRYDLQRVWAWEIDSGHYPNRWRVPRQIGFPTPIPNPAIPPHPSPSRNLSRTQLLDTATEGTGPERHYLTIQAKPPHVEYPPRPVPGSVADMDIIMEHCDFSTGKFVRDCLELLRIGGGLDHGQRLRRGDLNSSLYIFSEDARSPFKPKLHDFSEASPADGVEVDLVKKKDAEWEPHLALPSPIDTTVPSKGCDPNNPRLFHMFWAGPFTDKPYLALLSFLFTQNTFIHLRPDSQPTDTVCRPKFWMWINPGPAASVPNPNALRDMYNDLKQSPWAAPFLHPRFKDVIQFKLWNTTEQLDGVPELKDEWRDLKGSLFNSGGNIISVPGEEEHANATSTTSSATAESNDILNRTGSKSASSYDRLTVILSDMARFVLCHRFGGIYLDADTIFLRDWEELWGWKGAFAYRWSRLEKYNTAVLRMNKGSALGTFLFKTALKNGLDFHPMTVSRYVRDAHLESLLIQLPDALFDSAWLNTEYYQRERPPQPYFYEFSDFFDTPVQNSAAPQALGFNGFFKGAYSYHFHNFWWKPFDSARNWPDLGPRFIAGEKRVRAELAAKTKGGIPEDKRDLDWSTVMKRTVESYIRGERPNLYGEWIDWS